MDVMEGWVLGFMMGIAFGLLAGVVIVLEVAR